MCKKMHVHMYMQWRETLWGQTTAVLYWLNSKLYKTRAQKKPFPSVRNNAHSA